MVYGLASAEKDEDFEFMVFCLRKADSIKEIEFLKAVSMKGSEKLRDGACTRQILQEEVASVFNALVRILRQSAQKGIGKPLLEGVCRGVYFAAEERMRAIHKTSFSIFADFVGDLMKTIHEAAKKALEQGLNATSTIPS